MSTTILLHLFFQMSSISLRVAGESIFCSYSSSPSFNGSVTPEEIRGLCQLRESFHSASCWALRLPRWRNQLLGLRTNVSSRPDRQARGSRTRSIDCASRPVGAYAVKRLIYQFTYVDAMVVDTPITDEGFAGQLQDARDIRDRLERCSRFLDYLDREWQGLADRDTVVEWPAISGVLRNQMEGTLGRVNVTRERRGSTPP
jgi:hypothetical protein